MTAAEYLALLKMQWSDRPPFELTSDRIQRLAERNPDLVAAMGNEQPPLTLDAQLELLSQRLAPYFYSDERIKTEQVALGELPTGQINAMALPVPQTSNAYVILFNQSLYFLIHEMVKLFCASLVVSRLDGDALVISGEPSTIDGAVVERAAEILVAYLEFRDPYRVTPFWPASLAKELHLWSHLLLSSLLFALAHEYSHVILGHLDGRMGHRVTIGNAAVEVIDPLWAEELAADAHAWRILRRPWSQASEFGVHYGLWIAGPHVLLSILGLLESTIALRARPTAHKTKRTHPLPQQRLDHLETQIVNFASFPLAAYGRQFFDTLFQALLTKYPH